VMQVSVLAKVYVGYVSRTALKVTLKKRGWEASLAKNVKLQ